jgi:hypothetical protein
MVKKQKTPFNNRGKNKILCNSQYFAYAPTSEMLMTISSLSEEVEPAAEFSVIDNGMVEDLIVPGSVDYQVYDPKGTPTHKYLLENNFYKKFDLFFSSYDPILCLYAWYYNKPSVFYDGILFLWNFDEESLLNDYLRLTELKFRQNKKKFWETVLNIYDEKPHEILFMPHLISTVSAIRKEKAQRRRLKQFPFLQTKIVPIGAIVNENIRPCSKKEDYILISLSGSLTPTLSFQQNMQYAYDVLKVVDKLVDQYPEVSYKLICNPKIYHELIKNNDEYPRVDFLQSVTPRKYHSLVGKAKAVLLSPAISSTEIAAYQKTLVFYLPEQNGCQPTTVELFDQEGYPVEFGITVTEDKYDGISKFGDFETERLSQEVHNFVTEPAQQPLIKNKLEKLVKALNDPNTYQQILEKQEKAIRNKVGNFKGASSLNRIIRKLADVKSSAI